MSKYFEMPGKEVLRDESKIESNRRHDPIGREIDGLITSAPSTECRK
jgi:hypothetical protein